MIQPIRACQTLHKTGKKTPTIIEEVTSVSSKAVAALGHPTTTRKVARRGTGTLGQQKEDNDSHRQHKKGIDTPQN
jgi:hypothetical protein